MSSSRWVSREEVMAATGWGLRKLQREVKEKRVESRPSQTGPRGRATAEYRISSLPFEARVKLEQKKSALAKAPALIAAGEQPPAGHASGVPAKVALSEEEDAAARARYRIIEPLVQLINFENGPRPAPRGQLPLDLGLLLPDGRKVQSTSTMCEYLAHAHKLSQRTIWRMYKGFRKAGLPGLARRIREDKGQSRFFAKYPKAATHAAYVYVTQRQSMQAAFEAIHRDRTLLGIEPEELPTYGTVRSFLNALPEPAKVLAREGAQAYRERMSPYLSRDYSATASNEIWVSDHMIHDVEVQNDLFRDLPSGAPMRLRFTCVLDFHSRFVVGCSWCREGSSHSIVSAIRQAMRAYGPAEVFYCDNGKDYLKVAKGAIPAYLIESGVVLEDWYTRELTELMETGVLARLGIAVRHCIVRHPQSKHVERFFRTVHDRFDKKFPTYTGGSPATRPDFTREEMTNHRKLLRMGSPGMSLHPPASYLIRMALAWIEDYHATPHRGKGMDGRTPRQVFEEDRNPRQKPVPPPEELAVMLGEHKRRRVHECSFVLEKKRYSANDQNSAMVLHEMNEREVIVAYDPLDLELVAVLDLEGRLIAWARQENYVRQSSDAETSARIAESMQQRRRLQKHTRQTILGIEATARANGAVTEVEHLAMRSGLMAGGEVVTHRPLRRLCPSNTPEAPLSAADIASRARKMMEEGDLFPDAVTQRPARLRPSDTAKTYLSPRDAARLLEEEEQEDLVTDAVTQHARLRPSNTAEAPPSAAQIAKQALKGR